MTRNNLFGSVFSGKRLFEVGLIDTGVLRSLFVRSFAKLFATTSGPANLVSHYFAFPFLDDGNIDSTVVQFLNGKRLVYADGSPRSLLKWANWKTESVVKAANRTIYEYTYTISEEDYRNAK